MNIPKYDRYLYMKFAGDEPCPPFYVGIGKHGTRRHEAHERRTHKAKSNPAKNQFLLECKAAGIKIRTVIPETCLTLDEACRGEIELISIWGRRDIGTGYLFNMNAGGAGARDPAPSTRAKMSEAHRGKKHALGWKHSNAARERMSAWQRGRPGKKPSLETRGKMSAWQRGRKMPREAIEKSATARRGLKMSSEARKKMSEAHRGKKLSSEHVAKVAAALRGRRPSPETMAAAAAANLGRAPWNLGKNLSPEICAKISAAKRRGYTARTRSPDQGEFKF
jgi:hypothetical protein